MASLKTRLHLTALLAAIAFLALWPGLQAEAQPPGPGGFWPDVSVELDGYWVGQNENVNISSQLQSNDYMYDAWVQFIPPEWFVADDAAVPDGAFVGDTWENVVLGILNGPCDNWSGVGYQWQDATTNTANNFTYNPATDPITSPTWPGYNIMGSGLEQAVEMYPNFLNDMGFPAPRARYYSHVSWAGVEIVAQYLVFELGESLPGLPGFDPGQGYPTLIVFQDPTAPPEPNPLTDVCTSWSRGDRFWPWSGDNPDTVANEDGNELRRNPGGDGNYNFMIFARPRPDADGDGIENDLDTCPYDPDWDENPRGGNGPDGDGLDSACDPEWDVYNEDEDGDGYLNRGDNCPLDANGLGEDNQADGDGDGIGDACDFNPGDVDGDMPDWWFDFWVEVSGDNDADGWSDALENIAGSQPWEDQSTPEGLWRTPWTCADGLDNDLDGLMDGYDLGCDADNDGVANMFDACPENQEDRDGFQDNDGCPEADNDMDGICDPWYQESSCDGSDGCPNVPEDYDAFQDWDGCPDMDNDNDGFPDVTDDCPATDWTVGPDGDAAALDDNPHDEWGVPIDTREDYDGIIDWDGCHDSPGDDYDNDGFADEVEAYMGTDPTDACPDDPTDDAWPLDMNMDGDISFSFDVLAYRGKINWFVAEHPEVRRLDLNADGDISFSYDVLLYRGRIMEKCK